MGNETAKKHHDLGNKYFEEKNFNKADEHYQKMIKAFPTWAKGYQIYIKCLKAQNRTQDIETVFKQGTQTIPSNSVLHYNYAIFLSKQGRNQQAKKQYRLAIKAQQGNPNTHQNLAILLKNEGNYEDARAHYQRASELNTKDAGICFNYAILLQEIGKLQEAQIQYRKSIVNQPKKVSAHLNLGLLLKQMGRAKEAENQYLTVLEIDQSNFDACFNLGALFESQRQFSKAIQMYTKSLSIDPDRIKALYNLGLVFQILGKISDAAANYKKILALDPQNSEAAFNLAIILKKQGPDGRKYAQKYYDIVAKNQGDNPLYLCSRAENLFATNQRKQAFKLLDKARQIIKKTPEQTLKNSYQICDNNYEFIVLAIGQMQKFRKMEVIEQKMNEEDRKFLKDCEQQFFTCIGEPKIFKQQEATGKVQNIRQSFIDFGYKYDEKLKQLEHKYNFLLEQNEKLMKKLSDFEQKLMWEEKFDERLDELEQQGQVEIAFFARNLCWMLCVSIQSYRAVGIGVVEGGDQLINSKAGQFVQSLSCLCNVASNIPIVGKIIRTFSLLGEFYVEKDKQYCGQKIIEVTTRLYSERKILKAATDSILEIIQNPIFLKGFQQQREKNFFQIMKEKFALLTNDIMNKLTEVKVEKEEEICVAYCMRIMCGMLEISGKPSNPILLATKKLLQNECKWS